MMCKLQRLFVVWLFTLNTENSYLFIAQQQLLRDFSLRQPKFSLRVHDTLNRLLFLRSVRK